MSGDADKAAERTAKLAGLDQIASIDADIEFKQEISVTQVVAQSPAQESQNSTSLQETAVTPPPPEEQSLVQSETISEEVEPAPIPALAEPT